MIFKIIYYLLFSLTLLVGIYYFVTSLWTFKKKTIKSNSNKYHKFGVLVACRNEERVIGNLIESLNLQNYPKELYDIIIIPNNCTDNTRDVALEYDVKIVDVDIPTKTKGEVLKYTFHKLAKSDYDAYVVFDADNLVDANFLNKMNDGINRGYEVAQGFRDAKNPSDSWITGSYAIYYYIANFFTNNARCNYNGNAWINGTGFMVLKSVIDKYGFDTKTLTEDSEFTGICTLNDVRVGYVSDAITYDEHPVDFVVSYKQRKRWTSGTLSCLKHYHKDLVKKIIKEKNLNALDMLIMYMAPIIQVISFLLPIYVFIYNLIIDLITKKTFIINFYSIYFFLICYLLNVLINIFIVKIYHKKIKDFYKGIIMFPVFVLTWIPINIVCIFKKTKTWEEIKHDKNIKISNLNKI